MNDASGCGGSFVEKTFGMPSIILSEATVLI
jgi:hypothetical protein